MSPRFIIGIDEVGRGPLAGPVVVGAVLMPARFKLAHTPGQLRDSKKLTAKAREEWAAYISSHPRIGYALGSVSPSVIDRMNIARAANLAALRAARRLAVHAGVSLEHCTVYLDGGLYLGNGSGRLPGRTVIKGDEYIPVVALASIVAKVHRDGVMVRCAKQFPGYGFEAHKGYGTQTHYAALRRLGPSRVHRLTFLKKWNNIDRKSHGRRTNKTSYSRQDPPPPLAFGAGES